MKIDKSFISNSGIDVRKTDANQSNNHAVYYAKPINLSPNDNLCLLPIIMISIMEKYKKPNQKLHVHVEPCQIFRHRKKFQYNMLNRTQKMEKINLFNN